MLKAGFDLCVVNVSQSHLHANQIIGNGFNLNAIFIFQKRFA